MEVSSIFDKISTFFGVLFASPLVIIPTIILGVFIYELFFRINREDVHVKQFFGIGIGIFILFTFTFYFTPMLTGLDSIVTGILTEYYFPSIAVYMMIIVLAHIIVVLIMLEKKIPVTVKKINIIMFASLEVLFFEFLYLTNKYHLLFSNINKIHANQEILNILELTTFITFVWIIIDLGFIVAKYSVPKIEAKEEESTFPQESVSQFIGVPLFPQEKIIAKSVIEEEDIRKLQRLYEEEQKLVTEQLKLMILIQEKEYQKLSNELQKLVGYSRKKKELKKQLEAYDILLHNEKITMEEEIDLLLFIHKKEQEKVHLEIEKLLRKLSNETLEK